MKLSGAEKLKDMAVSIYDSLTKKSDIPPFLLKKLNL